MTKPIAIVLGEPNSIFSEIIFKLEKMKKKISPFIIIGNIDLMKKQSIYLNYNLNFNEIDKNFKNKELKKNTLSVININFFQKKEFETISSKSNEFIFNSFDVALELIRNKKVTGIINGPIAKETLLKGRFNGITEYLASKTKCLNNEVMLIYNNKISVSPITTHIAVNKISISLNKKRIVNNVSTIFKFYKKYFKKKIKIGITGLNPHCFSIGKKNEEQLIIKPAIKILNKKKISVSGPISADTIFINNNIKKFDVVIGMYHDQVLTPMKTLFEHNAINITLGLPFIRISPDHGVAADIVGKNKANPQSLIECLKFFKKLK